MRIEFPPTLGLVLAGGQARRMGGGDKALIPIGGVPILDRALAVLRAGCDQIVLSADGDPQRFAAYGLAVISDSVPDFAGPLAGILAGMDWMAENTPDIEWMVSVPGDCPFLPADIVVRLHESRRVQDKPIASAQSGDRRHPVVGLWPSYLREDLRRALRDENLRKVETWTARHGVALTRWPDKPVDPFFNVNTPEDARVANALMASLAG